jgi:hypothetical protein
MTDFDRLVFESRRQQETDYAEVVSQVRIQLSRLSNKLKRWIQFRSNIGQISLLVCIQDNVPRADSVTSVSMKNPSNQLQVHLRMP